MVCSRKSFSMGRKRNCYPSAARTAIVLPHGRTTLLLPCYHAVCIVVLLRCTVALSLASATPSADSSPSGGGGGGGGALGDGGSSARKPAPTGLERSILKRCVCTGPLSFSCLLLFCRDQFCSL